MKKILFYFILCFMLLFIGTTAYAELDDFTGTWKNIDQNTGGITKLRIRMDGSEVRVHAWGKCHPKDCAWGAEKAYAYGPNASSNIITNARVITASYKTKFSRTILVITRGGSNKLYNPDNVLPFFVRKIYKRLPSNGIVSCTPGMCSFQSFFQAIFLYHVSFYMPHPIELLQ